MHWRVWARDIALDQLAGFRVEMDLTGAMNKTASLNRQRVRPNGIKRRRGDGGLH